MDKTVRKTSQDVIDQILKHCDDLSLCSILEPSAGSGDLVEGILNKYPTANIDCVELNFEKREILKLKGFNVVGEDFLSHKPTKLYDYIIACPTYKNNVDVEHITLMYEHLKVGGTIVSLTSPFWTVRNDLHQTLFRRWLEDKKYSMVMLKDFSFVENYKTQPSMIIKIEKNDN
jgi:hypothetical protein